MRIGLGALRGSRIRDSSAASEAFGEVAPTAISPSNPDTTESIPDSPGTSPKLEEIDEKAGEDQSLNSLKALREFVDDEFTAFGQRKSSFETRGFAIITANVAVFTVLLTLVDRTGGLHASGNPLVRTLVTVGLMGNGSSILAALVASFPVKLQSLDADGIHQKLAEILEFGPASRPHRMIEEIIETRAEEVRSLVKACHLKGWMTFFAFIVLILGSVCHSIAMFILV